MIRKDIVDKLSESSTCYGITRKQVKQIVVEIFDMMADCLLQQEDVVIRGFGHFRVKYRKSRIINHPSTKEKIVSDPKFVILFEPARNIKRKLRLPKTKDINEEV